MAIAFVLDFPGGTRQQYDQVIGRMQLSGRMPSGGRIHVAGSYGDGWRVIDVWDDPEKFERFRDEQIIPFTRDAGLPAPTVRVVQIDEESPGNGESPALVQCVTLPGMDRDSFHAADAEIRPGGQPPEGLTWHVNGPVEGGWCVIDGWNSKELRDRFIASKVQPAMEKAPLQGPPQFEDLMVDATLAPGAS
jgi:hypothetical protein